MRFEQVVAFLWRNYLPSFPGSYPRVGTSEFLKRPPTGHLVRAAFWTVGVIGIIAKAYWVMWPDLMGYFTPFTGTWWNTRMLPGLVEDSAAILMFVLSLLMLRWNPKLALLGFLLMLVFMTKPL